MHLGGLDRQRGPAHGRPGQSGGNPRAAQQLLSVEHRLTQQGFNILLADAHAPLAALQQADNGFADDACQLLFKVANTGFAAVALDHGFQRGVVYLQLVGLEAMPLQ